MVIRKAPASAVASAAGHLEESLLVFDEAPEFMDEPSNSGSLESVDMKVKAAQEQLLQLRAQQEEIERQKQHLENLRVKQERFVAGKRELLDKLNRAATHVERELYEAQKRVDDFNTTNDELRRHLEILKALQPEKWHRTQVDHELDQALVAIENAEGDYTKGMRRLHAMGPPAESSSFNGVTSSDEDDTPASRTSLASSFSAGSDDLATWLRRGFAFTLPLIGTVLVAIVLIRLMF